VKPPIVECDRCGQAAYVGPLGIACACTPRWSAEERLLIQAGNPPEPPLSEIRRAA
jgi:hypothetical protein